MNTREYCECKWDAGKEGESAFRVVWCAECHSQSLSRCEQRVKVLAQKFRDMADGFDTQQKKIDYWECASMLEALNLGADGK